MSTSYEIIRSVRRLFHTLVRVAEDVHRDLAITAGQRAILESVSESPGRTVPDIAREKEVTRQHVQVLTNQLVAAGHVELRDNPAHRRSPVLHLTSTGIACFEEIRRRERALLRSVQPALEPFDLDAVSDCLGAMNDALSTARR